VGGIFVWGGEKRVFWTHYFTWVGCGGVVGGGGGGE